MTRTYVSTVIPHSADKVWEMIKDFREYRWGEGVGDAQIENGLDANTPGAIRILRKGSGFCAGPDVRAIRRAESNSRAYALRRLPLRAAGICVFAMCSS